MADRIAVASGQVVDSFLEETSVSLQSCSRTLMASTCRTISGEKNHSLWPPDRLVRGRLDVLQGADAPSAALEQLPEARFDHLLAAAAT